ncbi:MAG: hypothetical protein A2428_15710 [Bdellovibrionales bacterium RIFOXYC1_FULL_54_43]|nr:MAG: hypothetical protein A2428_15710 [Bdellovibrionales bacterium RIFOXYC1_FULL_54_43]
MFAMFHLTVLANDARTEEALVQELTAAASGVAEVTVTAASRCKDPAQYGQILFLDSQVPISALDSIDRAGRAVFLILPEGVPVPSAFGDGKFDDVLVRPFRPAEVISKIFRYQQILMWDEVSRLNASFSELLTRLKDDVQLAERLQRGKLPIRFPDIKGFKVTSRYLAGMRAGGDHFDLAESTDKNVISMVLSDSSSYGLSSAVLSVLMRVAMKLSSDEARSSLETVRKIRQELLLTLSEKDRLSLFYGVVSRKDYVLRYVNFGSSCAFYAPPQGLFQALPSSGESISRASEHEIEGQLETVLGPGGRLALLSDGFVEGAGGSIAALELLNGYREREAVEAVNELTFRIKSKFTEEDDMPSQDCTAAIFDLDSRLMRLAPTQAPARDQP